MWIAMSPDARRDDPAQAWSEAFLEIQQGLGRTDANIIGKAFHPIKRLVFAFEKLRQRSHCRQWMPWEKLI